MSVAQENLKGMSRLGPFEENMIVIGDCLDIMAQMPDGCVDLVVTDPPFATPVITASAREGIKKVGDFSIVEGYFRYSFFPALAKVSAVTARWYIFCDNVFYPVLFRAAYELFKPDPQLLIWNKGRIGFGFDYRRTFELILYVRRKDTPRLDTGGKAKRDILNCPPVPSKERLHPAQKPEALLAELIGGGNDLIFDPFIGSGTTAVVADRLGRKFFGCDINPDYVEMALKRLEKDRAGRQLELL